MNTQEKLERYSDLTERLTFLTQSLTELKDKAIPDEVKEALAEIDAEYKPMIDHAQGVLNLVLDDIKTEVLTAGSTVKSSRCMAVWAKGRSSWNGKLLDGYAMDHPEILQAKKIGEPTDRKSVV